MLKKKQKNFHYELRSDQQNANGLVQCTACCISISNAEINFLGLPCFSSNYLLNMCTIACLCARVTVIAFIQIIFQRPVCTFFRAQQLLCCRSTTKRTGKRVNTRERRNCHVPVCVIDSVQLPFSITRLGTEAPLPSLQLERAPPLGLPLNQIKRFQ